MSEDNYFASRIKSFADAVEGIAHVLQTQQNARIHAVITLAVFLFAFIFQINRLEWIALTIVVGMVWTAEILNTALEMLVDLVSPEHSQGAGKIKDVSAGAVFVSAMISIWVGFLIFGPKLWDLIASLFE
jgi:diacylglycerol kinase